MEDKDYSALSEEEKAKRAKELWAELKALRASMMRSDWHAGFESILRLDTYDYGSGVHLLTEEVLGEEPPRADFIVLVEEPGVHLDKSIFQIFRRHNVIEYKNPNDDLNERVLRKVTGYANFYIGLAEHAEDIRSDEVTISVFREKRNPQMFRQMMDAGTLEADAVKGIYHVKDYTDLPYQIVITSELEGEEYAAYRVLSDKAKEADVKSLIVRGKDEKNDVKRRHFRVLLGLVAEKNPEIVEDIMRKEREEMSDALTRIMKDDIDKVVKKKVKKEVEKSKMDDIRNVMETLGLSIEKAMDALKIPADKRASYMAML